jgi:phosphoserine phosphatase RsbU/P
VRGGFKDGHSVNAEIWYDLSVTDRGSISDVAWAGMFRVMEQLASSSDHDVVLGTIIDALRDCLDADRATVFVYDTASKELCVSQAHGLTKFRMSVDGPGIAAECGRKREMINIPDAYADVRFNPKFDKESGYRTRSMLTIPLMSFDGRLEGVAQVLNKRSGSGVFGGEDEALAKALASQAAVALRRARALDAERRKTKLEQDLVLARSIQQSTFPKFIPSVAGYDIAVAAHPAEETGGDTYDVLDWLAVCPSQRGTLCVLADATGHGVGPALSVAQFRGMFRMGARLGAGLREVAGHVNQQLAEDLPTGRFITACYAHLDSQKHVITYESYGQGPIVVVRANGDILELGANGPPLGVAPDVPPDDVEPILMGQGDRYLLLSDGYYEAPNEQNEYFGVERVAKLVMEMRGASGAEFLARLDEQVLAYAGSVSIPDDRTAIVISRLR